jgi:DNA-binding response OmpR family regulator
MGQRSSPESANRPQRSASGRVLIIEDETIIATDIALTLEDLGYDAIGLARTHEEALALGLQKKPTIIIADIVLSDGTSGVTAVDELLKSIDACVIFITGSPEFAASIKGPCLVVPKPFSLHGIEGAVAEAAQCWKSHECIQETKWAVNKLAHGDSHRPGAPDLGH